MKTILNSAAIIANATVYRARVGLRREFKSEAEALAYEDGFNAFLDGCDFATAMDGCSFPATVGIGWMDAEKQYDREHAEAREERIERDRERDDV